MFCPQCGTNQSDELKFCKSCGSNLYAVRKVVATREVDEKFDWGKTWVAEMFLSPGERERRKEDLELQRGITSKRLAPFPQTQEILAEVKTRYRLAVVSDAQSAYGLPELRAAGLADYFASIIVSGDYGYRKPDPRLFHAALTELQVFPEEAIFVGNDRFRDVLGARKVGMKTILFCPHGNPGGSPETEPDYILYQYADLPRAIEFFNAG